MRNTPRQIAKLLTLTFVLIAANVNADERCANGRVLVYQNGFAMAAASSSLEKIAGKSGLAKEQISKDTFVVHFPKTSAAKNNGASGDDDISCTAAKALCDSISKDLKSAGLGCEGDMRINLSAVPKDPYYNSPSLDAPYPGAQLSAIHTINIERAWDIETGASGTAPVVAVIDTGISYNHYDLAANIWVNPNEIAANGIDDDGNGYIDDVNGYDFANSDNDPNDDNGHGTHVAGTIGAVGNNNAGVTGMAWNVKMMAVKFLTANGGGYISSAVKAVNYAVANGAKVLNNSWGGGGVSQALNKAIANAVQNGVLVVAAAGNSAADNDTISNIPANIGGVISVAAVDKNGKLASFSNYGAASVHIAAPGVNILSTYPTDSAAWLSGTSMASPHVAGILALAWAKNPSLSAEQLKVLLLNSVSPMAGLQGKVTTTGIVNAGALLEAVAATVGSPESGGEAPVSEPTPAPLSSVSIYHPQTNEAVLNPGQRFNLDVLPGVDGEVKLAFKLGNRSCPQIRDLSGVAASNTYAFVGKLPPLKRLESLTVTLSDSSANVLATGSATVKSQLSKSALRERAVAPECKLLTRSIKVR